MKGIIYLATNKINGKVYVGQTIESLQRRKTNHQATARNEKHKLYFHSALRKYGEDAFEWRVLEEVASEDKCALLKTLNKQEMYYIALYESNNADKGYNLTAGGGAHTEMAQAFWSDQERSSSYRKRLEERMTEFWSNDKNRKKHKNWMLDFYKTEEGATQAKRHGDFMTEYYNGENARQNKAKTSHWFVKAISPDNEEMIFVSSKEPNLYFNKDIKLRQRLKKVGDVWTPTIRSFLFGWSFEAIEKFAI